MKNCDDICKQKNILTQEVIEKCIHDCTNNKKIIKRYNMNWRNGLKVQTIDEMRYRDKHMKFSNGEIKRW
jgi:hypothetical protein